MTLERQSKPTGILGGSFNPPHRGHLALARTVLDLGLVGGVTLIPAAVPPHKNIPCEADAETRLAMTKLLAGEDARLEVDDLELRRNGPNYTIDTMRQLIAANPDRTYRLIIGSDMAKMFALWRDFGDLLRLAPPLIAQRPDSVLAGSDEEMFPGVTAAQAETMKRGMFRMEPHDISSTDIRRLLADGADDATLLPYLTLPVLAFIRQNTLYGDSPHCEER